MYFDSYLDQLITNFISNMPKTSTKHLMIKTVFMKIARMNFQIGRMIKIKRKMRKNKKQLTIRVM